jgi:signal transduction histidine kinase
MINKNFTDFQDELLNNNDEILNNKYFKTNIFTYYLILGLISLALVDHSISSYLLKNYFPVLVDSITLIIYAFSYLLRIKKKISSKIVDIIIVYGMVINICTLDVYYISQKAQTLSTNFLYSLLFMIVLIAISSLIVNFKHVVIIGLISIIRIWCFSFYVNDPSIWSVFISINLVYLGVAVSLYFIVKTMNNNALEYQRQESTITSQNNELKDLLLFKDDMLHMILHDIRNPINRILASGKDISLTREEISESGKKILLMAENILDIYKLRESKMVLNPEYVNINELVNEAVLEVDYLLELKKINIIKNISTNAIIRLDENLIKRLMVNILTNAIKFSKVNSSIEIRLIPIKESIRIEVIDNGKGIAPEFINKIFDKFYHEKTNNSDYHYSTGLGLTFCKLVMESHGGKIGVNSVSDKGTTIWFEFPDVTKVEIMNEQKIMTVKSETIEYNAEERKCLSHYKKKLNTMEIYQTGEMYKLLYSYKCGSSSRLLHWKNEVINASITGNVENFNLLKEA